jgi:predicted DNA-binding transcriptional regulator AlpA
MNASRYLSTSDAATYVGVSSSYLAKLRCYGGGPRYIKAGRGRVLYDRLDLDDWLASRKRQSTSDNTVCGATGGRG